MDATTLIAVAGPPGSGKTTWIRQLLANDDRPMFYCCPGMGKESVDLARIAYSHPSVQVFPEEQTPQVLASSLSYRIAAGQALGLGKVVGSGRQK